MVADGIATHIGICVRERYDTRSGMVANLLGGCPMLKKRLMSWRFGQQPWLPYHRSRLSQCKAVEDSRGVFKDFLKALSLETL
jgi:hypothetical protein